MVAALKMAGGMSAEGKLAGLKATRAELLERAGQLTAARQRLGEAEEAEQAATAALAELGAAEVAATSDCDPSASGRPAESPRGVFQNGTPWVESDVTRDAVIDKRHPRCQVCVHKDRYRIECAKVAGRGLDDVAKEFGVHRDSLWRHMQRHVTPETKIGYLAGPAKLSELANLAADENKSLIEYLAIVRSIIFGQLDRSAQRDKPYEVERLSGRAVEVLQAIGKVTGELSAFTSQNISVTNNTAITMSAPIIAELQANLMTALAPYPDARRDVIAMFVRLDDKHNQPAVQLIEGCANA